MCFDFNPYTYNSTDFGELFLTYTMADENQN